MTLTLTPDQIEYFRAVQHSDLPCQVTASTKRSAVCALRDAGLVTVETSMIRGEVKEWVVPTREYCIRLGDKYYAGTQGGGYEAEDIWTSRIDEAASCPDRLEMELYGIKEFPGSIIVERCPLTKELV